MSERIANVIQISHQNPDATMPLIVPVLVLPNTPSHVLDPQIAANSRSCPRWLDTIEAHDGVAVICGGGPSLSDTMDEIAQLMAHGATVFALNGASLKLSGAGYYVDYQVIVDAQIETAGLVDEWAAAHMMSSTVHPDTLDAAPDPTLFHMNFEDIETHLPPERVAQGGYTLVGGGVSVGITALCLAYAMGFRKLHLFGYDSSNRGTATHAYPQPLNAFMPTCYVEWAGKEYLCSLPMKLQAEAFPNYAHELIANDCEIHVHGDGLLPAMWHQEPMTEREKYQKIWGDNRYRDWSPGETSADKFIEIVKPDGHVIDFGCGTGRGGLKIAESGLTVTLVDFVDNCRDRSTGWLPFLQWDLTQCIPLSAPYGYCTDVMEHIPTEHVSLVIDNIMAAAESVYFQIAVVPDNFGAFIGQKLHLTVKPHRWWADLFRQLGYRIVWQEEHDVHSCFHIKRIADA